MWGKGEDASYGQDGRWGRLGGRWGGKWGELGVTTGRWWMTRARRPLAPSPSGSPTHHPSRSRYERRARSRTCPEKYEIRNTCPAPQTESKSSSGNSDSHSALTVTQANSKWGHNLSPIYFPWEAYLVVRNTTLDCKIMIQRLIFSNISCCWNWELG